MQGVDIETRVVELMTRCEKAPLTERLTMRPEVQRVIRTLNAQHHDVPRRLKLLKDRLEEEAFDDMFDNMPI